MKNHDEFRASVYARAEREKERVAARRLKARNASLSVAMVLLVAALAVPLARNARTSPDNFTTPEATQHVLRSANRAAALSSRMVLLVATPSGQTQAVVWEDWENKDQQKDFASKCRAAMNLGEGEGVPFPAMDLYQAIHSTDELTEFLAELPEAAEAVGIDYDEVFFADKNLYAMPMELPAQPLSREEASTARPVTLPTQLPTIPDGTIPDGDATEEETTPGEPAMQGLPEDGLPQGSDVKVLLLVPVDKG